ncbi:class I SAM-dependent methyltransferase [Streptomyces sp. Je 1-4]|uniref:class I SAM-dependent methyltransferase n=1 Tax=Streptomyces TaxID=1883 RepID=UPI00140F3987|nr:MULTISPECIES: class I SAM-dependent methyltransferase [unclassified Streptomyces]QIK08496.1 class I SAM-dependent methyltransferase [Streptomyces sp. ID38640]UYB42148.1 class I SAM-dependent methyltransferase [Streptomyces sp. Je 1-4]UZQ38432.1 class I SAM-dependent methyltransferase [Streptomyces sp. Je 1-4] [Streptomyces sp. Je 1-4 4N24]UZQ45849.1 class I SAM-dependent methyltransferase [Streptomyces sp. Je 1-4] [Streptomyces sp. Je 1-4 4N24_ara]
MTAPIADQSAEQLPRPTRLSEVKGWFFTADQLLFDWFLKRQQERSEPGDLLELGAYMGKSAIFLGARRRAGERFTVCDLFDSPAEDTSNSQEMKKSYATLTRRAFEANYLAFHEELPTIVQGLSSIVGDHVEEGSVRFAHIDASHLYEHVHGDILAVRELLTGNGVVVMDDYRAEHCPGVAAATWQAVANEGLRPICITGTKFYGTWGDPEPFQQALVDWIKARGDIWHEVQYINDAPLVRLSAKGAEEPAHPVSRYTSAGARTLPRPSARAPKASAARPGPRAPLPARSALRRIALDVLPPVVTRAVVNARRRARTH